MFWTYFLITCSLAALLWATGTIFWRYKFNSKLRLKKNFIAIVQLFSAVFFLVGAGICLMNMSPEKLNGPDSFVKLLSYTFQLFTLDETFEGALALTALIESKFFRYVYTGLSLIYSVLVPLAGGFIIFNLLSSIVPRFRLFLNSVNGTKFVFSELNERSITLAEDIAKQSWLAHRHCLEENKDNEIWLKHCTIIFLNVDKDDADREFYDRASRIGAICMNDDILERSFSFFTFLPKKIVYFMMDTNPWSNLNSAVSLLSTKRELWKRTVTRHAQGETFEQGSEKRRPKINPFKTDNMNMYVFTENPDAGKLLEDAFGYNCERSKILYRDDASNKTKMDDVIAKCDGNISVFVVNEYKNLVYKLLMEDGGTLLLGNLLAADEKKGAKDIPTETSAAAYPENAPDSEQIKKDLSNSEHAATEIDASPSEDAPAAEGKEGSDKKIKIAIFGGGKIAKEFFKTLIWCAQMLDPDDVAPTPDNKGYKRVKVEIDLMSDNARAFEQDMHYSCPAIFAESAHGNALDENTRQGNENQSGSRKSKYIDEMSFDEAAFGTDGFEALFNKHDLYGADLFLIALGDDDLNLRAASWTRKKLLQKHSSKKTSLYFAIEDDALCATLKSRSNTFSGRSIVEMVPFGALKERFSYSNVVRPHLERVARDIDDIHSGRRTMKSYICNYNFESSTAAALHGPFRKYSIKNQTQLDSATVQRLYWLEHRRWSAYIATLGVVYPTAKSFFESRGSNGAFRTNRLTDSGWHSCLTDSYAIYTDPADVLKKIIRAYGVEMRTCVKNGKVVDDLNATLASGELLSHEKICAREEDIRGDESLDEYIDRWFKGIFEDDGSFDADRFDALDKLSVFMSIHNKDKKVDLKAYDIDIAKNTFLCETQQALLSELDRPIVDARAVSRLVDKFLTDKECVDSFTAFTPDSADNAAKEEAKEEGAKDASVAKEGAESGGAKGPARARDVKLTYVVSVDDGDHMLIEGDYVKKLIRCSFPSSAAKSAKAAESRGASDNEGKKEGVEAKSAGKNVPETDDVNGGSGIRLKQSDAIIVGADKMLVKVPLKGNVRIGFIGGCSTCDKLCDRRKKHAVYMFQEARRFYTLDDASDYTKSVSAFDNRVYYYICDNEKGFDKEASVDPVMKAQYSKPWSREKISAEKAALLKNQNK